MYLTRTAAPFLALPRWEKQLLVISIDASLCTLTVWLALCLRQEFWAVMDANQWRAVAVSLALAIPVFAAFGLYRAIFRHAGWAALMVVIKAVASYGVLYALVMYWLALPGVPRTLGLLQPLLLLLAMAGSRATARYLLSGLFLNQHQRNSRPKVLIYGAGSAGRQLAAAIANGMEMRAVGYLDDDSSLHGQVLNGLRIYAPAGLHRWVKELHVSDVLLAIPSVSRQRRNEILDLTLRARVSVRTLPGLMDLAQGRVHVSDLRELDIEDLLGRDAVTPNATLLGKNISGKVVLVTGAGGSIGSELCRQIIKAAPTKLLLLERSEFALYAVHQELLQLLAAEGMPQVSLLPLLASVCDEDRLREIMRTWKPHTVYHTAAYKHVPLVEHNPAEGLKNNVIGTLTTATVAAEQGVSDFVLISTDKAVRPTNVMGASKRVAEIVLQAMAAASPEQGWDTRFTMVRFGNVLGSSGSVVPLFRKQIKDGGPITLTHADITRYFMTIPEAAQLVIQAGAMADGGDVFLLDMGEPVRIIDLARRMVELSGMTVKDEAHPNGDIELQVTGLRPGEKLYEELLIGDNPEPTQHARIMKAREGFLPWEPLQYWLASLSAALATNDVTGLRIRLAELVQGYKPAGDVVDWVHMEGVSHERRVLSR